MDNKISGIRKKERKKERKKTAAMNIQKIGKRYSVYTQTKPYVGFKFLLTIFNDIYSLACFCFWF
jgi:hypothetical protein